MAWRNAIEDYEYLTILQRLGKGADSQKIVRTLAESFFQWEKDAVADEKARVRLAAMITATAASQR